MSDQEESFSVCYAGEQIEGVEGISYVKVRTPLGVVRMTAEEAEKLGNELLRAAELDRWYQNEEDTP